MVYYETTEQLMALAKERGIKTTKDGLLYFNTGKFTGRSPKDRYFSEGKYTDNTIDFERVINQRVNRDSYLSLKNEIKDYIEETKTFSARQVAGYNYEHSATFKITSTEPWAIIFFNNMLIDPQSFVTTFSTTLAFLATSWVSSVRNPLMKCM